MISIPSRYSYIEAYLSLRCNMSCSYCINGYSGVNRKRQELTAREWILGLNNLDTQNKPITLGGGEPTIHPEFYDIINGLRPDLKVDILTNGKFDVGEFIRRVKPERMYSGAGESAYYKSIRVSFHAQHADKMDLVKRVVELGKAGFKAGIFGLNHPENLLHNVAMTQICADAGVYFFVRDFLGFWNDRLYGYYKHNEGLNGNKKRCLCRPEDFLIGPDGSIYRCHRDLYDSGEPVGSILNIAYELKDDFLSCSHFGLCNPCDLKLKLRPDLVTSKCSVEIKI